MAGNFKKWESRLPIAHLPARGRSFTQIHRIFFGIIFLCNTQVLHFFTTVVIGKMYKAHNMKWSLIFLSGVGLGIIVGLLVAPEPGRVTLLKAKAEADRIVDKVLEKERVNREARHTEQPVVSRS
jgi:hypothetical protein